MRILQLLFDLMAFLGNRLIARQAGKNNDEITLDDFIIVPGKLTGCLDLIAIAR